MQIAFGRSLTDFSACRGKYSSRFERMNRCQQQAAVANFPKPCAEKLGSLSLVREPNAYRSLVKTGPLACLGALIGHVFAPGGFKLVKLPRPLISTATATRSNVCVADSGTPPTCSTAKVSLPNQESRHRWSARRRRHRPMRRTACPCRIFIAAVRTIEVQIDLEITCAGALDLCAFKQAVDVVYDDAVVQCANRCAPTRRAGRRRRR